METVMEKEEAHRIIERMPPNATWGDLIYAISVRNTNERGLADSEDSRTKDVRDVRARYGLSE